MQITMKSIAVAADNDMPELSKELQDEIAARMGSMLHQALTGGYVPPPPDGYMWLDSSGRIRSSREAVPAKRCKCRGVVHMCCVT